MGPSGLYDLGGALQAPLNLCRFSQMPAPGRECFYSLPLQGHGVRRSAGGLGTHGTSSPSGLGPGNRDDHLISFFLCLFQAT